MPIARMAEACHRHGAQIVVDAVQACGMVPIDVESMGIDYLSCGAHKWLMGMEGGGFLFVHPERVEALRPSVAGWLSHENGLGFLFEGPGHLRYDRPIRKRADFVESGNYHTAALAGLGASLGLIQQLGVQDIYQHVNGYHDRLEPELIARGFKSLRASEPSRRSGTLSVIPPEGISVVDLHKAITVQGISCAIPDGILRFSPHWPNAWSEIPAVLAAVESALQSLRR
jgi:cysteine desulfurase / selenocysteine lyase